MLKVKLFILFIILTVLISFTLVFKANGGEKDWFCLDKSYQTYKNNFLSKDGRIIDYEKGNITTSEGESYMMLRSLVMNDKKTFDLVYNWTKTNLQREDKLFSWLWGKNGANYGVLDPNSASDADIDIAFALISAYEKYNNKFYLEEALPIIRAIWDNEVKKSGEYLILMPGAKQNEEAQIEINPSYFSPYAFKVFQKYDDLHDWYILTDSSYEILFKISNATKTGLFTDWCVIENNRVILNNSDKNDFSYDAIRVFPRVYLDYFYTKDARALKILKTSEFFVNKWQDSKNYYTIYRADGTLGANYDFIGAISLLIPVINTYNPKYAFFVYENKLLPLLENNFWEGKTDYYGKNLTWFGIYIYQKAKRQKPKCKK